MKRFFHSVENIIFLDGDDVRRAPMAATLFRRFAARDPLLKLWRTKVSSAGSGKFTVAGAFPDKKAQQVMQSLGLDISSHRAKLLAESLIGESSIVLGIEGKHVEYAQNHVCDGYPAYRNRIISFFDYLFAPDMKFDGLIDSNKISEFTSFTNWIDSLFPRLVYRLKEDTHFPLLAKGKGLGSAVVKGPIRIVTSLSQAQEVRRGDVVVCDINNIIDVYGRGKIEMAGAIVTDSKAELSQLSQIGHELNIPCVGGTTCGTKLLDDGSQVLVDATRGHVYGINQETVKFDD